MRDYSVVIRGAGDIASGIAHRLFKSGFSVVMTEIEKPLLVRQGVSFGMAVYEVEKEVEQVIARKIQSIDEIDDVIKINRIPVLIDEDFNIIKSRKFNFIVDATMRKHEPEICYKEFGYSIGIGPGFTAGKNVDAVIETYRCNDLGRVIYAGTARKNTGVPNNLEGVTFERILRAPCDGVFQSTKEIGDYVIKGDVVGYVGGVTVHACIDGYIRGLLQKDLIVTEGMKLGDIDFRKEKINCYRISDKARAVAGGVLEAIMHKIYFPKVEVRQG